MSNRQKLTPNASHSIDITPTGKRVVVTHNGRVIAESTRALTLSEATYPPEQYLPLGDVDTTLLERTEHTTYCPYKGQAGYYSIVAGDNRVENAVWVYEEPYEAVADIAGYVAFYPDGVDIRVG